MPFATIPQEMRRVEEGSTGKESGNEEMRKRERRGVLFLIEADLKIKIKKSLPVFQNSNTNRK